MIENNNEQLINLDKIFENNNKIRTHAETKSYYSSALLGLLFVPLLTLLSEMLSLNLFLSCLNKTLFVLSLIFFVLSLFSLFFSFIPRSATKSKNKQKNIIKIAGSFNNDYYHYGFWANIKFIKLSEVEKFLNGLKLQIIGSFSLLNQIVNIAWIAKIKFRCFTISVIFQTLLVITMVTLAIMLLLN